jgi:hypothetical protein
MRPFGPSNHFDPDVKSANCKGRPAEPTLATIDNSLGDLRPSAFREATEPTPLDGKAPDSDDPQKKYLREMPSCANPFSSRGVTATVARPRPNRRPLWARLEWHEARLPDKPAVNSMS